MCIIIAKHEGQEFNMDKVKFSQTSNEDGYGAMWYNGSLQTFHTLSFESYLTFLENNNNLKDYNAVLHLRYATVGEVTSEGCHPFDIGMGQLMHNGTIFSYKPAYNDPDKTKSDSSNLALTIKSLVASSSLKVLRSDGFNTIMEGILGSTINRCVIMDKSGDVHIYNEALGNIVDGIWYSNMYHVTPRYVAPKREPYVNLTQTLWDAYIDFKESMGYTWEDVSYSEYASGVRVTKKDTTPLVYTPKESVELCDKVFVYGTLKQGFHNNRCLGDSKHLYDAVTVDRWAMIGRDLAFPYLIEKLDDGNYITGEVYQVNEKTVKSLDSLEGYPYHYNKKMIEIYDVVYNFQTAWVYYDPNQQYTDDMLISNFIKGA